MPMKQRTRFIQPTGETQYLVGPEGLVWVQPAIGEPFILAANNETQREAAQDFFAGLLGMGLVPYGVPLNQRQKVAMFGGPFHRDCQWVPHAEAPPPVGDEGDSLPTQAGIIIPENGSEHVEILRAAALALVQEFGIEKLDALVGSARKAQLVSFAHTLADNEEIHIETARERIAEAARRLRHPDMQLPKRGGTREGAGRPRKNTE